MSERAAAMGAAGAPHTIEHEGKTYAVSRVLTEGVMLRVEEAIYDRERRALASQRDMMPEGAYMERLDALRKLYADGEFSFESARTMELLKTQKGAVLLLKCMMDCSEAELLVLLTERGPEVQDVLKTVLMLSMPKESAAPKAGARRKGRRAH